MSRRAKILVLIGCFAFVCLVVGVFYQKEIRIAYHRNRMWAASDNYSLFIRRTATSKLDGLKIFLFRMSEQKEIESFNHHMGVLLEFGYLEKRDFWFTNRICNNTDTNLWAALRLEVNKTFDGSHWKQYYFPDTNRFEVIATPADMPKWEKLISDFDK